MYIYMFLSLSEKKKYFRFLNHFNETFGQLLHVGFFYKFSFHIAEKRLKKHPESRTYKKTHDTQNTTTNPPKQHESKPKCTYFFGLSFHFIDFCVLNSSYISPHYKE